MSSSFGPNFFQQILTLSTLFNLAPGRRPPHVPPPYCTPRRMPVPLVQPSAEGILQTLSPTDAHVFRSALANVPLVSHAPPFFTQSIPSPANFPPDIIAIHAQMLEVGSSLDAVHAKMFREQPVAFYAIFVLTGSALARVFRIDDIRYVARAALRFTAEELDEEMYNSILGGTPTWETFKPLVSFRKACMAALMPLIDLGPPPVDVIREYAWTWHTCPTCVTHIEHAPGDACTVRCRDASWFIVFWKALVAKLRATPDPNAVLGLQQLEQAIQGAIMCPTCSKVAHEHLRCFRGLLVVEAAKRIAEVPFAL